MWRYMMTVWMKDIHRRNEEYAGARPPATRWVAEEQAVEDGRGYP